MGSLAEAVDRAKAAVGGKQVHVMGSVCQSPFATFIDYRVKK